MRSGCLGLIIRIGVVSVAAIITAVSLALIVSFAVSALGQPAGTTNVFRIAIAAIAGLTFFLIGRNVWHEIRGERPRNKDQDR